MERIAFRRSRARSVFLRYKGSQLRRVWGEGVFDGTEGPGRGMALSGEVSAGAMPCISDILILRSV